ncbi:MAG: MBL fold metallo-hydrolase [Candidatus Bathyarchaeia archaeon]
MKGGRTVTRNIASEVNRPAHGLRLWWLGNAGFAIRYDEILMFIDPVIEVKSEDDQTFSETGLRLQHKLPLRAAGVERADIVLLTHHHGDHAAPKTLSLLKRTGALFICPEICMPVIDRISVDRERVRTVDYDQTMTYGEVSVKAVRAIHGGHHGGVSASLELGAGYLVKVGGYSIFHPGDTVLMEEHYELSNVDILLLPICRHSKALTRLAEILAPRHIIAMHYDTYEVTEHNCFWTYGDPEETRSKIEYPERLVVLEQGETFRP